MRPNSELIFEPPLMNHDGPSATLAELAACRRRMVRELIRVADGLSELIQDVCVVQKFDYSTHSWRMPAS